MELAQLRAFLEAAERGSFRRAAEALYLTQPSLSARVHALEEDLGVLLFHRMGRGVRLTEMGRAFLPFAERAMEALRQGRDVIDNARDSSGGVLNMASARAIGTYTLPSILEKFRLRYPNIKVHINIGRSSDVLQMVVNEEVQLGLARALTASQGPSPGRRRRAPGTTLPRTGDWSARARRGRAHHDGGRK